MKKSRLKKHSIKNPHPLIKVFFLGAGLFLILAGVSILWVGFTPIPSINSFDSGRRGVTSTKLFDRTGKVLLYDLNHDVRRTNVTLAEVSPYLQKATISIEDRDFYNHGGISIRGIARSIYTDIVRRSFAQGGSTITQQVVKNTILTGKKSIVRKIQEWVLATRLERQFSKEQILEFYFNVTPYGGTIYGAEAASHAFFAKNAKDLTLAESAYLAGIPQLPTYYSPYGNNRSSLDARKNTVLANMRELGYINDAEYESAKKEVVVFGKDSTNAIRAPHFVFYIEQYLESKYGPDVATQGLTVLTTLDSDLQKYAEASVKKYAAINQKKFNASNEAVVAIDPKTGQILTMIGSRDYFDKNIDGNFNSALALRQPGSSFKPFVYAAAIQKGYTPQTVIFDLPTQFSTACAPSDNYNGEPPCYSPGNYDGKFRGPMTFTTALAQSINVPAVKALYLAGIGNTLTLAKGMGLSTLKGRSSYGLSLALGAAEVRLLDLTNAYGNFANNGVYNPPTGILQVTDSSGLILEKFTPKPQQSIDSSIALTMSSMLSNNEARFPEYPANNPFTFAGYDVAAKTGTTNESRDAWTVGYTPSLAIGAWAGNNDNSPMVKEIAGYIVAPMWHEIMAYGLTKYPKEFFGSAPETPIEAPQALQGIYSDGFSIHDILHWVQRDSPRTPGGSFNDPQYSYWEYPLFGAYAPTEASVENQAPTISTSTSIIQQNATTTF
jgi:1A family penicillin-binding protein